MSVFGENTIGGRVALDITGSYPTGLMAALGVSYNDPQELINAQLRYTAAQVDINAQHGAQYSQTNLDLEKAANVAATDLATQLAANIYKNASFEVNFVNQTASDLANVAYTDAYSVYKICCDASYIAYLTYEASSIIHEKAAQETIVASVGKSKPNVNIIDITTLSSVSTLVGNYSQDAHNATILAQTNALQYLFKTQSILGSAIVKSNTVTNNLEVVAAFDTLVRAVLENIADPLNSIAGKESLITQYVPSVPVNNAIQVANIAIAFINGCITASKNLLTMNYAISTNTIAAASFASTLDNIARVNDATMYLATATSNQMFNTASTMKANGSIISIPNEYPYSPYQVTLSSINIANAATKIAMDADISAVNARGVSNAILSLRGAFQRNLTPDIHVYARAVSSLKVLTDMMETVKKVTTNSSAYSAVAITRRASNTINGQLSEIIEQEEKSINASNESRDLLTMLRDALSSAVITDLSRTHSVRAISAPCKRPEQHILTPFAPLLRADAEALFIARL